MRIVSVAVLVFDGVMSIDISGPADVLSTASKLADELEYQIQYVSINGASVTCSNGLVLNAVALNTLDVTTIDVIIVPGGETVERLIKSASVLDWIKQAYVLKKRICSVCLGAFILAKAGVLEDKRASTHWMATDSMQKQFPNVDVDIDAIFVDDGNIKTAAGGSCGIDMALSIVKEDCGEMVMFDVARYLVVYAHRPGSQQQFRSLSRLQKSFSSEFTCIQQWIRDNASTIKSVEQISEHFAMSLRTFHRKFEKQTGQTPAKFLEMVRIEMASELLRSTSQPLKVIAQASGFTTEQRLFAAIHRHYQLTPSEFRVIHNSRQ